MGATDEIFRLTNACASLLGECQSVPSLAKDDWIGRRLADFNLWAAGIRAATTGHESLDYRVRDRSDLKDVLLGILSTIKESAGLCLDANITPLQASYGQSLSAHAKIGLDKSWSDFSDSTDASSSQQVRNDGPLATEMGDISLALNQLYRITLLIQRSGKKHRFKRADGEMSRLENDEDYIQLKRHLEFIILLGQQDVHTEAWEGKDYDDLFRRVTMPSDLTPVHRALIKANIVRRNRIRYATQHLDEQRKGSAGATKASARKLDPGTGEDIRPAAEVSATHVPQTLGGGTSHIQDDHESAALTVTDQDFPGLESRVNVPMTATEIGTMPLISSQRAVNDKDKGTIITRITRIGLRQDYPPCPTRLSTFQCPYCAQALSGDYTNISRWRGHVKQDLMPYTCVFENCKSLDTNELFESSEEWMAHLVEEHSETIWVCSLCPAGPDGNDETILDSNAAWQNHIREAHPDTFPAHQLDQLAGMSERVSLSPMACPFCRHYDETEAQPYDHIASHLHEFALRALPWSDNQNDRSYAVSGTSVRSEGGRAAMSRSTINNDGNDSGEENQLTLSSGDIIKQLREQISDQAATSLRLGIPEIAKGYQNVLEQLPTLLDRVRALNVHSVSQNQHDDKKRAGGAPIVSIESEDKRKDRLDGYIRPLLRIRGIAHAFSEQMEDISEREATELEESLQDECAALRQLFDNEDPSPGTEVLVSQVSESSKEDIPEIQRRIETVVEKRQNPSHESSSFFEEAFRARIELATAEEELTKHSPSNRPHSCKVEDVESRISEVLADSEKHHKTQAATANIGYRLRSVFAGFSKLAATPNSLFAFLPAPELAESVCGGMVLVTMWIYTQRIPEALVHRCIDALTTISSAVTTNLSHTGMEFSRQNNQVLSRKAAALCTAIFRLLIAVIERNSSLLVLTMESRFGAEDNIELRSEEVRAAFNNFKSEARREMVSSHDLRKMMVELLDEFSRLTKKRTELARKLMGQTHETLAKEIWKTKQDAMRIEQSLRTKAIYPLGLQTDLMDETTRQILEHFRRRYSTTDRVLQLFNDKKLRSFVGSWNSSTLLIRDEGHRQGRGRLAVSFATATMVRWLRGVPYAYSNSQVYTLASFCDVATSFQQPRSARDIMIQLVSQLMVQYRLPLPFDNYNMQNLEANTDGLFGKFARLLLNLSPHSRVYCIIDAFDPGPNSVIENDHLLANLMNLAWQSFSNGITMKVLITTSKSAVGFRRHLGALEILDMGLLKSGGARGSAHFGASQFNHTAVGKMLEEVLVR